MKIIVCDNLSAEGIEILKKNNFTILELKESSSLKETIKDFDALIVRSATRVTKEIIDSAKKLKVIGRAGIGVDNIDIKNATYQGIVVMNSPEGNIITTAEHTLALILSAARNIPQAYCALKEGKWEKKKFVGVELSEKILGIIGLGNIGKIVAEKSRALNLNIISYDPFITEEVADKLKVKLVGLDELLSNSDIITIHTPLTDETKNLINYKSFKKMKKSVILINCARGGIVNENDLMRALDEDLINQVALDVFTEEPVTNFKLVKNPRVIATPHLGASTKEANRKVAIQIANQISDYLLHGILKNSVNISSIDLESKKILDPYISLGERLGKFSSFLIDGRISEINILFSGEIASQATTHIKNMIIVGILSQCGYEVNLVNAEYQCEEKGIRVVESKKSHKEDFTNLISLKIITDKEIIEIAGTIFGKNEPRIVKINEYRLEFDPSGYILFLQNYDKPGVIGSIGTLLGANNINIGNMQLGRAQNKKEALALINIDCAIKDDLLKQISRLPNIISAKLVLP